MIFVLDASAILSWCFEDETPENADALLDAFAAADIVAPVHWPLEVANTLWASERRKRLTAAQAAEFIALVEGMRVILDWEAPNRAWRDILELARREAITTYDAAYLELAMRLEATLVSRDQSLLKAALANNTATLELRAKP